MSKEVVLENGIRITGATLLTTEEAKRLPEETRAIGEWWWLRSPGSSSNSAANVLSDGFVSYLGYSVNYDNNAVRPALMISNPESSNLQIGDRFRFGEKEFEIISADRALCTESIGDCAFREDWLATDANDYEASNIKMFVDEWYTEQVNTLNTQCSSVSESSKTLAAAEIKEENPITLENGITVTGATLLTYREAEKLPKEMRAIGRWWWLRSPGGSNSSVVYVDSDGSIGYIGGDVSRDYGAVRPALIINPESSNLRIGDVFHFGGKDFEIISDTQALCTESVDRCAFRKDYLAKDANDYEKSDVKKFVNEWYVMTCELIERDYDKKKQKSMLDIANMMTKNHY